MPTSKAADKSVRPTRSYWTVTDTLAVCDSAGDVLLQGPAVRAAYHAELRAMVERQGFVIANMNYSVTGDGGTFEYHMVIHSPDRGNTRLLSEALNALPSITAFRIAPSGD